MQHIQHGRPGREGARLDRVRLNETITDAVFGWRRRRVYARITALSGARPGYRILDIGCGGGYLARLLAAPGRVTGVDPSAKAVRYAQRRSPANCSFPGRRCAGPGPAGPVVRRGDQHAGRAPHPRSRAGGMASGTAGPVILMTAGGHRPARLPLPDWGFADLLFDRTGRIWSP